MDALEFIRERNRMCKSFGRCCNERLRKTRQSLLLEQYPYARSDDGVIMICPKMLDTSFSCPLDDNIDCSACKREFWMQEVK